jgi:FMN reductase (NADPH)
MNETLELLYNRKSTRVFTDQLIAPTEKDKIIQAATQAPTAGNKMLYAIIDVTDQAIKDQLAISCDNQPFIGQAPMVLVFCADYQRFYDGARLFVDQQIRQPGVGDLFLAMSDTLIAAHHAVIAADSLGIGSCYIGDIIENFEFHKQLFNLPHFTLPVAMVVFGYPTQAQKDRVKPKRFDASYITHHNQYQSLSKEDHQLMISTRNKQMKLDHMDAQAYYYDYVTRKYLADFSLEMNRSVALMLQQFMKK